MMSEEQLATARAMYLSGKSTHQIGFALGVTGPGIYKALKRIGVHMRDKGDAIRLTYTVGKRPRGPSEVNSVWTQERINFLVQEWNEGATGTSIAERLSAGGHDFTKHSVIAKAHRLGLPEHPSRKGYDTEETRRRAAINGGKAAQKRFSAIRNQSLFGSIIAFPPHLQQKFDECMAQVRAEKPRI